MQYHYPASPELLKWMGEAAGAEHHNSPIDAPPSSSLDIYGPSDGTDKPMRQQASSGDWIVKAEDGSFDVVSPQAFLIGYEQLPEVNDDSGY
jgi:hypothetical protein